MPGRCELAKLAFTTVGILKEPMGHPVVQGFWDRVPGVFESAEVSAGFVDRSRRDTGSQEHSWGEMKLPKYYEGVFDVAKLVSTLSVWEDLESVAAFAYQGFHGEAMALRREWFISDDFPVSAAWWVEDGHLPTFEEACERMEHLHEHGPTPFAFNFKSAFSETGQPKAVDPARVKQQVQANAS